MTRRVSSARVRRTSPAPTHAASSAASSSVAPSRAARHVDALQIANARGVPGTAAALVQDATGRRHLLTNHHVAFGGGARVGERVWALAPDRGHPPAGDPVCIGRASAGFIGRMTFAGDPCFVDCALVELDERISFPPWLTALLSASPWPHEIAAAERAMRVRKTGPTTGATDGLVVDVAYPDTPLIDGRSWIAPGQLRVESVDPELNFSASGDSGAALLDARDRLVGLLWGVNRRGDGLACPIAPALDHLGVTLVALDGSGGRSA